MYSTTLSTILVAFLASGVRAAIPSAGMFYQIQPTFRGSFPRTPCLTVLSIANGTELTIQDCTTITQMRGFVVVNGGSTMGAGPAGPITVFNNFCLEVAGGATTSGTKVQVNSCTPEKESQKWQWNSNGTVNLSGTNQCLDLTDGNLSNGNEMQISTCTENNQNQVWSANTLNQPLSQVSFASDPNVCIGADSSANGAPVFVTSCSDTTARKVWQVPQIGHGNSGTYELSFGDNGAAPVKCLDVTDGKAVPGTKLQLWDCGAGNINQSFEPTGAIRWLGSSVVSGLCVDLTDGVTTRGNQLQLSNCDGNANEGWNDIAPLQTAI